MINGTLASLSTELAELTASAGKAIVRMDDGTRLTATGVVWEPEIVVTTSHGVERDDELVVETGDGPRLPATLVARDPESDLAVLRVAGLDVAPLPVAPDAEIRQGALVLALGRPGEAGLQVTLGVVSSLIPASSRGRDGHLIQTDALFYPGFSGGALLDASGRLAGLINLGYGRGRSVAIGWGIVAETVELLLAHGHVPRAYVGVRTQPVAVATSLRERHDLAEAVALLVVHVEVGSPAEAAGLLAGDSILRLGGHPTADGDDLRRALKGYGPGKAITATILRGGTLVDVDIVLGARE